MHFLEIASSTCTITIHCPLRESIHVMHPSKPTVKRHLISKVLRQLHIAPKAIAHGRRGATASGLNISNHKTFNRQQSLMVLKDTFLARLGKRSVTWYASDVW